MRGSFASVYSPRWRPAQARPAPAPHHPRMPHAVRTRGFQRAFPTPVRPARSVRLDRRDLSVAAAACPAAPRCSISVPLDRSVRAECLGPAGRSGQSGRPLSNRPRARPAQHRTRSPRAAPAEPERVATAARAGITNPATGARARITRPQPSSRAAGRSACISKAVAADAAWPAAPRWRRRPSPAAPTEGSGPLRLRAQAEGGSGSGSGAAIPALWARTTTSARDSAPSLRRMLDT